MPFKYISPFIYFASFSLIGLINMVTGVLFLPFMAGRNSSPVMLAFVVGLFFFMNLVLSSWLFWKVNRWLVTKEELKKPRMVDHLRQSSIYYLIGIYALAQIVTSSFPSAGSIEVGIFQLLLNVCVLAIIVNVAFLLNHRRST